MRNLVLYELVSVDGVAEEPGDWLFDAGTRGDLEGAGSTMGQHDRDRRAAV